MGNIITQATNNANSYGIDDKGNLSMNTNSTFTAQTGVFQKGVQFNDIIDAQGTATFAKGVTFNSDVTTTTVNGVDIAKLNNTVLGLSSGAGIGSFTGTVSAGAFTGTTATFDKITGITGTFTNLNITSNMTGYGGDFDNITVKTLGSLSKQLTIQGSTGSNINFSNGGTISAENGNIRNIVSNGGISASNITGATGYFTGGIYGATISSFTFTGSRGIFNSISIPSTSTGLNNSINANGLQLYGGQGIQINNEPNTENFMQATGTRSFFKTVNAGTGTFTNISVNNMTGTGTLTYQNINAGTVVANSFTGSSITIGGNGTFLGNVSGLSEGKFDKVKFGTQLMSDTSIFIDNTSFYGGPDRKFRNGITFENTGSNGFTVATGSNALFNSGLTVATGSTALFNGGLTVATGSNATFNGSSTFNGSLTASSLSLSSTGTVNMTGYTLRAGTGTFTGVLTASSFEGVGGSSKFSSITAGGSTFDSITTGGGHKLNVNGLYLNNGQGIDITNDLGTFNKINATGTDSYFRTVNAETGTFRGRLTASSFTGTSINASNGTFTGLTASSFTGTSVNASNGTFTGVLNANGGISLPTGVNFNLIGNMTGSGNINAGNGIFSGSGTFGSLTSSNMINANGGIQIGTSANKWQIKESNGGTATGLLCFAKGGSTTPYACIDTSGNLIAGTGYTVAL